MIEVGKPAPDFTGLDETGARVSLEEFRDRRVLLHFFVLAWTGV